MPELTLLPLWRIDGSLKTLSPLRIGDGSIQEGRIPNRPAREENPNETPPVETLGVFVDAAQRAYIPGSSLRGFLRSYLASCSRDPSLVDTAFGFQREASRAGGHGEGLGGAIAVWDARIPDARALPDSVPGPYWDRTRATCVASHVVLNRRTRTASDEMLFDQEYVPEGIVFDVTMLVEGGGPNEWTPDDIAGALLAALQDLRESPARLGASNAEGWGRLEWRLNAVRRMGERAIAAWLAQPGSPLADHLQPADPEALLALGRTLLCAGRSETLDFEIDLRFDAPFLVNDASRVKRPGETSDKPNHTPLKALGDAPLLPASSMHGAMRSQAERIARTLGLPVCDPAGKKSERPPAIKNRGECSKLDVVSRLFGAPGWRSPLRISDFTLAPGSPDPGEPRTQEFVAIDRFTGGGADKLKFNAEAFTPAGQDGFTLRGTLSLDAHRLALLADGTPGWWDELLHLLTYTLRDLCEGDVPAGFGRSKGYGACTALVSLASDVNRCMGLPEPARTLIRGWFAERRIA